MLNSCFAETVSLKTDLLYPGSLNVISVEGLKVGSRYKVLIRDGRNWYGFPFRAEAVKQDVLYAIPLTKSREIVLVLTRDGKETVFRRRIRLRARKFRVSRIRVSRKFLYPPKDQLERIRRENQLLRKTFKIVTDRKFKSLNFLCPVKHPSVSTPFGAVRIINGKRRSIHWGVDFRGKKGDPVFASLSGKVVISRELYYTGKTVVIDHGLGLYSLYAHLSRLNVKEGDFVRKGEEIGRVGSTGRSTGPHLHFGIYLDDVKVDPLLAFKLRMR